MGRFINADVFTSTGQGLLGNNMFVYCLNDPVNRTDTKGYISYTEIEDQNNDNSPLNDTAKMGNTTQIGSGHGNPQHRNFIDSFIKKLVRSGEYLTVYGNRALSTAGQNGTQRPDIIAIGNDGHVDVWEVASPSQAYGTAGYRALEAKIGVMYDANPHIRFSMILWEDIK